ncbi:MAG: putative rane-anchored protein [Acidimicrobiaceae bacterium]|nr:putative rane-anchored protein [Acidimicrobiaceae bacterium]
MSRRRHRALPMSAVSLRGSSWDHPRGHLPMLATAASYQEQHAEVSIEWVPRSLKNFGVQSVEQLVGEFDLVLIDHPHIGAMAASGCVLALDEFVEPSVLAALAESSPGNSHESYAYGGHQWALAIDAACQSSVRRPDLIDNAPRTWDEVVTLSESGTVLWPLCDVDSAASMLSIVASLGHPSPESEDRFVERESGRFALATMRAVAESSDPRCLSMNPIAVLEALSSADDFAYSPLCFCYVNYSRLDSPGQRLAYGDVPSPARGTAPRGALLGGVGLAVAAQCSAQREAVDYACFVAAPDVQRGLYFEAGGQPAHHAAWADLALDRDAGGFFSGLAQTMSRSWTRPREPDFAAFQTAFIELFADWYDRSTDTDSLLDELDELYRRRHRLARESTS